MQIQSIFSSFIFIDFLTVDLKSIEDYCYNVQQQDSGVLVSNEGGYHSHYLDTNDSAISPLFDQIDQVVNGLHQQLGFKNNCKQVIQDSWVNINQEGHYNKPHKHPGCFFSGVFYVKAEPGAGQLEWHNPVAEHVYTIPNGVVENYNFYNSAEWSEQPAAGKLVIFPSWLLHYTQPNRGGHDRISIAFNSVLG